MITNISVVHVKNRYAPKVTILPSNGITKSEGLCFFFIREKGYTVGGYTASKRLKSRSGAQNETGDKTPTARGNQSGVSHT